MQTPDKFFISVIFLICNQIWIYIKLENNQQRLRKRYKTYVTQIITIIIFIN